MGRGFDVDKSRVNAILDVACVFNEPDGFDHEGFVNAVHLMFGEVELVSLSASFDRSVYTFMIDGENVTVSIESGDLSVDC